MRDTSWGRARYHVLAGTVSRACPAANVVEIATAHGIVVVLVVATVVEEVAGGRGG